MICAECDCTRAVDLEQFIIGLDTGLGLGLPRRGGLAHPFGFAFQHFLAGRIFIAIPAQSAWPFA